MKKMLNLAIGTAALAAAAMASTAEAQSGAYSDVIYQNQLDWFYHGTVEAQIWTQVTKARLLTYTGANNWHSAWAWITCSNQPFNPLGSNSYQGNGLRVDHICPSGSSISNMQGWINDY